MPATADIIILFLAFFINAEPANDYILSRNLRLKNVKRKYSVKTSVKSIVS